MMLDSLAFWALLPGHLLGDFYFRPGPACGAQEAWWRRIPVSALALASVFLLCRGTGWSLPLLWTAALAAHTVVECVMRPVSKKLEKRPGSAFALGQLLHVGALAALSLTLGRGLTPGLVWAAPIWSCPPRSVLRLACLALFLIQPANVLLKTCNRRVREPEEADKPSADAQSEAHAGAVIGGLERLLVAVLMLLGQYGGIGFVFAAKTLTRYQKIGESAPFGEYYLIGTLGSLLCAVLATLLLFPPA